MMSIPILTAHQMEALCKELHPLLIDSIVMRCITFDSQRIFLILEKNSNQKILFLCFRKPLLRFHLVQSVPKGNHLDCPFTNYLTQYQVKLMEMLNHDRILRLQFKSGNDCKFFIGEFFSKHPNYYITDEEGKILFALHPLGKIYYHPPSPPALIPTSSNSSVLPQEEMEKFYRDLEVKIDFQEEKNALFQQLKQQLKQLQKRQAKLQQELKLCFSWEDIQLEGELLKANFPLIKKGFSSVQVWDWTQNHEKTIQLDPSLTPQEQIAQRFRRSKKLHKGISYLQEQLEKGQNRLHLLNQSLEKLAEIQALNELKIFQQQFLPKKTVHITKDFSKLPVHPYQEYESTTGTKIWVGKNARDNEKMTFSLARGSDWWLHVQGFPGSHIVIRTHKGQEPDTETLLDAMQLALYYSKAKSCGEAEILITQRKFVARLNKGAPGKVQVSKHKTLFTRLDPERYQRLKERR